MPPKTLIKERKKRSRDPAQTQAYIIAAAKSEFANLGLGGSRIDAIAEKAGVNKRMIYEYFNSKDELFLAVLEEIYTDVRTAERNLGLAQMEPIEAICELMRFTWDYYLKHPEFMSLVNSENLHKAAHIKRSERFHELHHDFVGRVQDILDRGVANGTIRPGINPSQLYTTMAAVGYYYLNNRYTLEIIYGQSFVSPEALKERYDFNIDTILRLIKP